MGDTYYEYLFKRRTTILDVMLRIFSVLLSISGVAIAFLMFRFLGIFSALIEVGLIYLTLFVFRRTSVEIEYCYLNGDCQFDKIFGRTKRKGYGKLEVSKIEIMAEEGDKELESYENSPYRLRDFSSLYPDARRFVAFTRKDSELIKVIFEPTDEMLESMQMLAPSKVHVDRELLSEIKRNIRG